MGRGRGFGGGAGRGRGMNRGRFFGNMQGEFNTGREANRYVNRDDEIANLKAQAESLKQAQMEIERRLKELS